MYFGNIRNTDFTESRKRKYEYRSDQEAFQIKNLRKYLITVSEKEFAIVYILYTNANSQWKYLPYRIRDRICRSVINCPRLGIAAISIFDT